MNPEDFNNIVCVIDDDELVRAAVCNFLNEAGFRTVDAGDGEAGMTLIERHTPCLIVTDIMMPKREGIETLREAKRRFPAIPVLAMSGSGKEGPANFLGMAHKLGADACLEKPFEKAAFLACVDTLVKG
ncbi:MAG TPA: response regulator [Rhizomicrobium sp.]|jgi:DNA-binding response OmpR family regulator